MSSSRPEIASQPNFSFSTPLAILVEEEKEAPWTEANEVDYQALLNSIKVDLKHPLSETDKRIMDVIVQCYTTSGNLIFIQKYTGILNIILDSAITNSSDDKNIAQILDSFSGKDIPLIKYLSIKFTHNSERIEKISTEFRIALKEKFGPNDLFDFLRPGGNNHYIYDAPAYITYKDHDDHPYLSLSTLAFPKYIDAVLTKFDSQAYEAAKRDLKFQATLSEVVKANKETRFLASLRAIYFIYRGKYEQMTKIPHLFYNGHQLGCVYINLVNTHHQLIQQLLPHPFLIKTIKNAFNKPHIPHHSLNMVQSLVIGTLLIAEKYPEFKDWTFLPKAGGKEPGFILESPDKSQRLYFKVTLNMFKELFCANILNHLGIKMAEASLFTTDTGNCFLVTRDLSREYQKSTGSKQKFFQPFSYAITDPIAFSHIIRPDEFESADEEGRNKLNNYVTQLFSDADSITKVSYAKLLLVGLALGLSDLGKHGDNIGPLVTSKENKTTTKIGIVDYFSEPLQMNTFKSLTDIHEALKSFTEEMNPLFYRMFNKLTQNDIQKALEQIKSPKCYKKNQQGYYLAEAKSQQSYEKAVESALSETMVELKNGGITGEHYQWYLSDIKNIVVNNLKSLVSCLAENHLEHASDAEKKTSNFQRW